MFVKAADCVGSNSVNTIPNSSTLKNIVVPYFYGPAPITNDWKYYFTIANELLC